MTILAPATETLVRCLACRDGGQRVPHLIEGRSWQKNYVAVCGASRFSRANRPPHAGRPSAATRARVRQWQRAVMIRDGGGR
jgi:hypothetical protein